MTKTDGLLLLEISERCIRGKEKEHDHTDMENRERGWEIQW